MCGASDAMFVNDATCRYSASIVVPGNSSELGVASRERKKKALRIETAVAKSSFFVLAAMFVYMQSKKKKKKKRPGIAQ